MITIVVKTKCGNSWMTRFNGTEWEAEKYFVGKTFNLGCLHDVLVEVISITRIDKG